MLEILVPSIEYYDEERNIFVDTKATKIQLEHSLLSISKWESKWKIPFMDQSSTKTEEQMIDYIRCMTINKDVDPKVFRLMPTEIRKQIDDYMNSSMTATWFREEGPKKRSREIITSEIVYWWMFSQGIPLECQKWHINRLLTQIRVCSEKNRELSNSGKRGRMSKDKLSNRKALNSKRKSRLNSKG